jgi:predicted permease
MSHCPPRLARTLVSILVPAGAARDGLLGDMHEMYIERRESRGRLIAGAWYWWSAVHAAARYSSERYRNRWHSKHRTQPKPKRRHSAARVDTIIQDVRYSARLLKRSPGFTVVAALTIAIGIGATSTVFTVVNSLLLRIPPGVRDPGGLVSIAAVKENRSFLSTVSYPTFEDYRDAENGLRAMVAVAPFPASLSNSEPAEPENVAGLMVSANYFSVLGTRPALGRFFLPEEDAIGDPRPVVVLSHKLWTRRFGADPAILGQTISLNRTSFTVIGVAEEGFQGHYWVYDFGLWVPVAMASAVSEWDTSQRGSTNLVLLGRLAPGSSIAQVSRSLAVTTDRLRREYAEYYDNQYMAVYQYSGMLEEARGPVSAFMGLLSVVAGIVLLIASSNVAGMLLSRATGRAREIAVRLSVGAGRTRLVRMLVTESVMLFLIGGTLGVFFTLWSTDALESFRLPIPIPMTFDLALDVRVLGFTLALALITGTLFGLAPALQVTKADLATSLKDERAGPGTARRKLRNAFVVAQVAGSVVLLIAAGLFIRALARAQGVDLGFEPQNVHALTVDLSIHQYSDDEVKAFLKELRQRSASLPGIESAALSSMPPLGFTSGRTQFQVPGRESQPDGGYHVAAINTVSPDYFMTMHIPILAGRPFTDSDSEAAPRVVVINRTAANRVWPGESALGKRIMLGDVEYRVIGVAGDGKYASLTEHNVPAVYQAFPQRVSSANTLLVRTVPRRQAIGRDVRAIARAMDPDLPMQGNAPYTQMIGVSLLPNKVAASVAGAFGVVGVVLAAVGLFAVLSSMVSYRTREIGIRIALGADVSDVRRMVITGGLKLTALGLAVGLPAALVAVLLIQSMLFGVSPADPVTFGGISGLLLLVSLLASYVPVRRATQTDPVKALRAQ